MSLCPALQLPVCSTAACRLPPPPAAPTTSRVSRSSSYWHKASPGLHCITRRFTSGAPDSGSSWSQGGRPGTSPAGTQKWMPARSRPCLLPQSAGIEVYRQRPIVYGAGEQG